MTRRQKDIVEYFPHDARASEGDTLTILQAQFGNDGYAFWFKLLEKLASTEGHCLDCNDPLKWQLLCAKAITTPEKAITIVNMLATLKAIDPDLWSSRLIWCQNLVENVADVYKNRRRQVPQKPITTTKNAITTGDNAFSTGDNPQSKVKYSKVDNYPLLSPLPPKPAAASLELPTDERFSRLVKLREHCTGKLCTGQDSEHIKEYLSEYPEEIIAGAIRKAGDAKATHWAYVAKVLKGADNGRAGQSAGEIPASRRIRDEWEAVTPKRGV